MSRDPHWSPHVPLRTVVLPPDQPVCELHREGRVFRFTTRSFDHGLELRWFVDEDFRGSQFYRQIGELKPNLDAKIAALEREGWTRHAAQG